MNEKVNEMMKILTATTGMSKEALLDNFYKRTARVHRSNEKR